MLESGVEASVSSSQKFRIDASMQDLFSHADGILQEFTLKLLIPKDIIFKKKLNWNPSLCLLVRSEKSLYLS